MQSKTTLLSRSDIGDYFPFFGSVLPAGYLWCDGSSLSTTTYASLFAKIQYRFGGAGASFNVPDTRGRVLAHHGTADDTSATNIGAFGVAHASGSSVATIATVPQHSHAQSMAHRHDTDGNGSFQNYHAHNLSDGIQSGTENIRASTTSGSVTVALYSSASDGNVATSSAMTCAVAAATTGVTVNGVTGHTQSVGNAESHNNMMAFVVIPYIIRYTY